MTTNRAWVRRTVNPFLPRHPSPSPRATAQIFAALRYAGTAGNAGWHRSARMLTPPFHAPIIECRHDGRRRVARCTYADPPLYDGLP